FVGMVLLRIGEASSQSISIKRVGGKSPIVPGVGNSTRPSDSLIVVEKDPVIFDVGKFIRIEEELRRANMHAPRIFVTYIEVTGEPAVLVVCGKFAAINFTFPVVKG